MNSTLLARTVSTWSAIVPDPARLTYGCEHGDASVVASVVSVITWVSSAPVRV